MSIREPKDFSCEESTVVYLLRIAQQTRCISKDTEKLMDGLTDDERTVIHLRTVQQNSLEQCGKIMGYCSRQVGRIQRRAIWKMAAAIICVA